MQGRIYKHPHLAVSVVMPVWNAERYLDTCLTSLQGQTLREFECIIVDDGSTDATSEILGSYSAQDQRFKILRQRKLGITAALNAGIAAAHGRYIARMDADDVCAPDRLERQYAFMEAHPDVAAVGSQVLLIDCDDNPLCVMERPLSHADIDAIHIGGIGGGIVHPTAFIRRSIMYKIGRYDIRWRVAQDLDLWLRLAENGQLANLPDILLAYRLHAGSTAMTRGRLQQESAASILACARQRRGLQDEHPSLAKVGDATPSSQRMLWRAQSGENFATARIYAWRLFRERALSTAGVGAFIRYIRFIGRGNNPEHVALLQRCEPARRNEVDLKWLEWGAWLGDIIGNNWRPRKPALLVIKPGSMGDALLFLGALRVLKRHYPGHELILVASKRAESVLVRCLDIDRILLVDESAGGSRSWRVRFSRMLVVIRVFSRRYVMTIFPFHASRESWARAMAGLARTDRRVFLDASVPIGAHEMDKIVSVLQEAGCPVVSRRDIWPDVGIRVEEREWARRALGTAQTTDYRLQTADHQLQTADFLRGEASGGVDTEQGLRSAVCGLQSAPKSLQSAVCGLQSGQLTLALCPGARFKQKQWGAGKFAELLVALGKREEARGKCLRVLILGGPEDRGVAREIIDKVESRKSKAEIGKKTEDGRLKTEDLGEGEGALAESQRSPRNCNEEPRTKNQELIIKDYTGRCTLYQSFALIEQSDLCVGNDTLGLHVAVAVGTPSVVMMWGGDGDQWIPWGNPGTHRMVRADMDCGGCGGACVHARHECMERISVEMAMEAVGH